MTGVELIAEERQRQLAMGFDDRRHTDGSLVQAAVCYASDKPEMHLRYIEVDVSVRGECPVYAQKRFRLPRQWPESWHPNWWKRRARIRMLTIAGALIAAEIDRLRKRR